MTGFGNGARVRRVKVLLLGAEGQLGFELRGALAPFAEVVAAGRAEVDLSDLDALRHAVRSARPSLVVNASAYTDVDGAEKNEALALRINAEAPLVLAEEAAALRAPLVHYSTDFVFDGRGSRPYVETDVTAPLGAYGRSKRVGEERLDALDSPVLVLRTAWVYSLRRKSFVSAILRLARERETLRIVADQVGNPTFARDLAQTTALMLFAARRDPWEALGEARGLYHLAGGGYVSRFDFARTILALDPRRSEQRVQKVEPIPSSAYPLPAERPLYAPLDSSKFAARFGLRLPRWQDALARAFAGS